MVFFTDGEESTDLETDEDTIYDHQSAENEMSSYMVQYVEEITDEIRNLTSRTPQKCHQPTQLMDITTKKLPHCSICSHPTLGYGRPGKSQVDCPICPMKVCTASNNTKLSLQVAY
jgi:hypothetical protein